MCPGFRKDTWYWLSDRGYITSVTLCYHLSCMAKFKLEDDPKVNRREPYPFTKIKVGQGFSAELQFERSIRTAASKLHKQGSKRFVVSKVDEKVFVKRIK